MLPQFRSDDILGGSFCSTDGFVDPYSVMVGFMTSAHERGATLWRSTEVTAFSVNGSSLQVETTRGRFCTKTVVNAAGHGLRRCAAICRRRSSSRAAAPHAGSHRAVRRRFAFIPMVIDMTYGFHFRPERPGFLLAWNDPKRSPGSRQISNRRSSRRFCSPPTACLLRESGDQS